MQLDIGLIKKFVKLERAKSALADATNRINAKIDQIREQVCDNMTDAGIQNMKVDGRTVYTVNEIWPKRLGTPEEVVAALKEADLKEYVKTGYNNQSVAALFREMDRNEEPLPAALKGVIEPNHVTKVKSIKS